MQCWTGNAARGLYYAWESILQCRGEEVQINLLLNRASPWLDIDSYLPYEGKVVIRNKKARRVAVRIPAWVQRSKLRLLVNGTNRPLSSWVGSYQCVDQLKPGDVVELRFPVRKETVELSARMSEQKENPHTTYTMNFRGNTLVDISPRDTSPTNYPMYQRDHMKATKTPEKTVQRFVTPELVRW